MATGNGPRPLFLLSLPRSGSTLVQRVLAAHEQVATTPEPWVLLPQVYAMRERGMYAEYVQVSSARAIREFAERLPNGEEDYEAELREFVQRLYARAGGPATYFLDKTPRYHFIVEDLFRLFPDARFVFLWRNPLAVAASIVETWGRGRWSVGRWRMDLYDGVQHLVEGYSGHRDQAHAVRYEDLVTEPERHWPPLFEYLGLPFDPAVLSEFRSVHLEARMGDRTGTERYPTISSEPIDKWKRTISTPIRKRWAGNYLEWIGAARLATMGYDQAELAAELEAISSTPRRLVSDLAGSVYWWADRAGRERSARLLWRRLPR